MDEGGSLARSTLCVARCLFAIYRDKKVKGAAALAFVPRASLVRQAGTDKCHNAEVKYPAAACGGREEIIRLSRSVAKCEIDSGFPPRNLLPNRPGFLLARRFE